MSNEEEELALALDSAFLRDCSETLDDEDMEDGVKPTSTPRMRLEAAQLLADKVGGDDHTPTVAYMMEEIFKGSNSFNKTSAEVENQQFLDEMDDVLKKLQNWKAHQQDNHIDPSEEKYDDESDEDAEVKEHRELYLEHCKTQDSDDLPVTARVANEKTMNALTSLVQQGAKLHDSDNEESTNDTGVTESSLLFRRIEEESRIQRDDSLRIAEEKMCTDGFELESNMSALEAQLRGFGSELDHLLQEQKIDNCERGTNK